MFYLLLFIRFFFLLSIWSKPNKKIKEPTNEKKRKIGEMFKLSLCLIYPLTPLGIASFSWTVLLFSRFMWRLHSYLISREQNKMKKKMWGKKIRIYQTALSSIWKISFDARCTMHILRIVSLVHFSMRTPNTDLHVHSSTTSKSMRKSTILEQIMHCNNSDEKTQLLVHILEF